MITRRGLSYKYRIEPTRAQATAFGDMLADFCQLYNAGLEQRIAAYRRGRISVSYKMQANELKGVRCAAPELARWSFSVEQQVWRRLDKTSRAAKACRGCERVPAITPPTFVSVMG